MKLHDDLADLKSYFDGQKDRFDEKNLFSIGHVQCLQTLFLSQSIARLKLYTSINHDISIVNPDHLYT